jgi:murein DD-endopeptidase MepM/ murein hydrolase activator NlpD
LPARLALIVGSVRAADGPAIDEGIRLAFVILSTGALTDSRLRTIGARTLVACTGVVMLGMLVGGLALGYRIGQLHAASESPTARPAALRLDQPEGRVIVDRLGALSGRLNRLERQAAVPTAPTAPATAGVGGALLPEPSGGPLIPVSGLEADLERLEATFARLTDVTTDRDLESMAFPSRLPLAGGSINSGFGVRRDPMTGRLARHTGIDMAAPPGTPIRASAGGRVRTAGRLGPYGNVVEIDHGNGLITRYAHASRVYVRVGELVMPQQTIATVGSTGRSTGPHLHFEVIRNGVHVEPRKYLVRNGS